MPISKTPPSSLSADELDALSERPFTDSELTNAKRVPFAKILRWRLRMTQEEFAKTYAIPLGTLRDWEQGRTEPDASTKSYLKVISAEPIAVANALKTAA
jgi:putative transcriptional regulator